MPSCFGKLKDDADFSEDEGNSGDHQYEGIGGDDHNDEDRGGLLNDTDDPESSSSQEGLIHTG